MVAGAAAFLYSYRTDLQLSDIRKVLLETARKIPPLEGKLSSKVCWNVYAALNYGERRKQQTVRDGAAGRSYTQNQKQATDRLQEQTAEAPQERQNSDSASDGASQSESTASTSKTIIAGGGEPVNLGW